MQYSTPGELIVPGQEPELAHGVRGFAFDLKEGIYIPFLTAEHPWEGYVSAFLDSLPKDRRVVFPNVINDRLQTMLKKRGFTQAMEEGDEVEIMVRASEV